MICFSCSDTKANALLPEADIIIRGHVTWAGKTSLEVSMSVEQVTVSCHNVRYRMYVQVQNWITFQTEPPLGLA